MAFRFNGGRGAVTCDECDIIFDEDLGPDEYRETYGEGPDHCWKHKDSKKEEKDEDLCCNTK